MLLRARGEHIGRGDMIQCQTAPNVRLARDPLLLFSLKRFRRLFYRSVGGSLHASTVQLLQPARRVLFRRRVRREPDRRRQEEPRVQRRSQGMRKKKKKTIIFPERVCCLSVGFVRPCLDCNITRYNDIFDKMLLSVYTRESRSLRK